MLRARAPRRPPTAFRRALTFWRRSIQARVLVSTVLLTLATMVVYPFEMATIVSLAGERTVGTYYGFYNTLAGIGIAGGNLLTGLALDTGRDIGVPALPWIALTVTGLMCAAAVAALNQRGHLTSPPPAQPPVEQVIGAARR